MKATEALRLITSATRCTEKPDQNAGRIGMSVAIEIGRVSLSELGRSLAEEHQGSQTRHQAGLAVHQQRPRADQQCHARAAASAVRQSQAVEESPFGGELRLDRGPLF